MEVFVFIGTGLLGAFVGLKLYQAFLTKGHNRLVSILGAWAAGFLIFIIFCSVFLSIFKSVTVPVTAESQPIIQPVQKTVPISLDDITKKIESVAPESILKVSELKVTNILEIQIKADNIDLAALRARDIQLMLLKNYPDLTFSFVRFVGIGDFKDQFNNKSTERMFSLTYEYPELKKFNLDNGRIDFRQFLNFAGFDFDLPIGFEEYKAWCEKGKNAENSGTFCNDS